MKQIRSILNAVYNPVFLFKLAEGGSVSCLVDLNQPALELLESTRDNIFLLKNNPGELFPFLRSFKFNPQKSFVSFQGQLYTQQDDSLTVEISPFVVESDEGEILGLSVKESKPFNSPNLNGIYYGNMNMMAGSSKVNNLLNTLNAAAEKMDKEITPENVFEAVKGEFKKLGFSCSIYLVTADQQFIYPKFLSYSPLIVKLAGKFFGVNPHEFMIPVDKISFSRRLVKERKTIFVDDARDELPELFIAFPGLRSKSGRIIEWMSRFLKKTISSPLVMSDRVIGALTVHSNTLEDKDRIAISAFAHQVASALHKARLLEDLQKNLYEKENAERALRISEARLKFALEAANDAIWDYNLLSNSLYLAPRSFEILGFQPSEIDSDLKTIRELVHPDEISYLEDAFQKCFDNPSRNLAVEYRIKNKQGDWIYLRTKAKFVDYDESGNPARLVGISSDITEQKVAENNLIHLAFHDTLTGLMNRKAFLEKSESMLASLRRKDEKVISAYFYIDLDHFKNVNDTFGHDSGDQVLKLAAERLKVNIREVDLLFRLGGDEFFLILTDLKRPTDASLVAEKLIKAFLKPFNWDQHPVYLHLSIGIALYPKDGTETWQLLSNADTALYKAKKERNTYRFYDEEMQHEAINKITIIDNLRRALSNNEFQVFYQPILTCQGELVAAEALIRWFTPDGEVIPPESFIPLAEESSLIIPIGLNVLSMVVKDMTDLSTNGSLQFPVSINISAKQLKQPELIPVIEQLLKSKSLEPSLIHLEITESSLMENLDEMMEKLDTLKKSGLKFSIDDFGTGYSSLSYLKKLPIDYLKIDKSFVTGLPNDQDAVIIKTIISMAQQLELKVIAEGVETKSQYEFLKNNGSPLIQGFYFSGALSKQDFLQFIQTNRLSN